MIVLWVERFIDSYLWPGLAHYFVRYDKYVTTVYVVRLRLCPLYLQKSVLLCRARAIYKWHASKSRSDGGRQTLRTISKSHISVVARQKALNQNTNIQNTKASRYKLVWSDRFAFKSLYSSELLPLSAVTYSKRMPLLCSTYRLINRLIYFKFTEITKLIVSLV